MEIIDLYSEAKDNCPNVRCCGTKKPFNLFRAMRFLCSAGSDAVALREAAYFGEQIIASDCVVRPVGALLFETMNYVSLKNSLATALENPEMGLVDFDFQKNMVESRISTED